MATSTKPMRAKNYTEVEYAISNNIEFIHGSNGCRQGLAEKLDDGEWWYVVRHYGVLIGAQCLTGTGQIFDGAYYSNTTSKLQGIVLREMFTRSQSRTMIEALLADDGMRSRAKQLKKMLPVG